MSDDISPSLSDLTSFNMIISRISIYVGANDIVSFFLMAEEHSIAYMCHFFCVHSSVYRHLGCFHVMAVIINSAAMNIGVHVSFWIMFFSGYMPRSRIAGSCGSSIFSF